MGSSLQVFSYYELFLRLGAAARPTDPINLTKAGLEKNFHPLSLLVKTMSPDLLSIDAIVSD
jgi:hypothetical protein